ncbi:MAG: phosphoribosyltransferase family protein [Candidatus Woesebacteria bacterium]|jgi:hypothetical protein
MQEKTMSVWQLRFAVEGNLGSGLVDQNDQPFDCREYSWFKYGYDPAARHYGELLAKMIIGDDDHYRELIDGSPVIIASAPYVHLATASDGIAHYLWRDLTRHIVGALGLNAPRHIVFDKDACGSPQYAKALTAKDRDDRNAKHVYHIDEALVRGAHVIMVDDIRVTGSAERAYQRYFRSVGPRSLWLAYAAVIEQSVLDCPGGPQANIENLMNQTDPVDLSRIVMLINSRCFRLNSRVLRYILERPAKELLDFLPALPVDYPEVLADATIGRGPDYLARYRKSYDLITGYARERGFK